MIDLTGKRYCFFVLESQTNDKGEFNALVAVDGETGYYKTDWFWGDNIDVAEEIARRRNHEIGLRGDESMKIVAQSMRKGAIEKPRF